MQRASRLQATLQPDDANNEKCGTSGPNDTCRKGVQKVIAPQHLALTDRTLQMNNQRTKQIATAHQFETKGGSTWNQLAPTAGTTSSQRISTATSDNEIGNQLSNSLSQPGEQSVEQYLRLF